MNHTWAAQGILTNWISSCDGEYATKVTQALGRKWSKKGHLPLWKLGLPACSRASDVPLLLSGLRLVLRKVMGQLGTAQCARTYSFQSRILPTGYKGMKFQGKECHDTLRFLITCNAFCKSQPRTGHANKPRNEHTVPCWAAGRQLQWIWVE